MTVNSGATISAASDASLTLGSDLTLKGGSLSTFALTPDGAGNTTALVNLTAGSLIGPTSGMHTITFTGTAANGTYDLFGFTGTAPSIDAFVVGQQADRRFQLHAR